MKEKLTAKLLAGLQVTGREYEVHDTTITGLFVRVTAAGAKSYVVTWARGRKKALGRVGILTLDQARQEATQYLAEARKHGEPTAISQGRRGATLPSLRDFINDTYLPWFKAHHRGYEKTAHTLSNYFETIMPQRIDAITGRDLEQIRTTWLQAGNKPATVNRKMGSISGVFSRAVEWEIITTHPMAKLKQLKVDSKGVVRYLSADESLQLRKAMNERQDDARAERDSANRWRAARGRKPLSSLAEQEFTDHLKPMILVSLNTGIRRGELFNLEWSRVNFSTKTVTVIGDTTKTIETRHIPLNKEAIETLQAWQKQCKKKTGYVFPSSTGGRLEDVKSAWLGLLDRAGITGFRWHDMRHDFASRLVMAGVPLNTVRDLLGHSDIKMTLRYAHLAPDSKAAAVELI
ncbi:integrase [Pseudomonas plecoglossicida]|uniref:Integrase n=1 Tax=Pseudomonas plecoglossicida TaxID=70775 RepID=A0ABX4TZT0_PSEDL|nr:tyrosine-type recombinase/integrase [Pseudomonas plecoglossicida]PLU84777.1 integrase [Pseudomonas plecoglossicida]PLU91269.1 integrase [Pseudomonas plecoglossicida]PLU99362.1 integrase [Pseudomonas plecoglossicida]PLV11717.1 integrase [Pseudomonas plecoglossicida]